MSEFTRQWVHDAIDRVMIGLHERRQRLGLAGLPEPEARLRIAALEEMPVEAFKALLAVEDDEARERQIMALENAQRRRHIIAEVYPSGMSSFDGRTMYRWRCACGAEAEEDSMDAETAKAYWGRHAGWLAPSDNGVGGDELVERKCRHCGQSFKVPRDSKDKYCSRECSRAHWRDAKR